MNRCCFFAVLTTATTDAHELLGDAAQDAVDGHLHLLQLSARRSTEKMGLDKSGDLDLDEDLDEVEGLMDDSVGHPVVETWPIPDKPSFGPDGTWATPYCKDILGCDRYCPDGCNGAAMWYPNPYPNTRIGQTIGYVSPNGWAILEQEKKEHFLNCQTGKNIGGPVGYRKGPLVNCLNSENSTKTPYWATQGSDQAQQEQFLAPMKGGYAFANRGWGRPVEMTGWGREFCPAQCVNDAATFKFGNFNGCGQSMGRGYQWYDGRTTNDVGPNNKCTDEKVSKVSTASCLWCGEPTTTSTTTEAPTTSTLGFDDEGDVASAADDPHMQTVQGQKVDLS